MHKTSQNVLNVTVTLSYYCIFKHYCKACKSCTLSDHLDWILMSFSQIQWLSFAQECVSSNKKQISPHVGNVKAFYLLMWIWLSMKMFLWPTHDNNTFCIQKTLQSSVGWSKKTKQTKTNQKTEYCTLQTYNLKLYSPSTPLISYRYIHRPLIVSHAAFNKTAK